MLRVRGGSLHAAQLHGKPVQKTMRKTKGKSELKAQATAQDALSQLPLEGEKWDSYQIARFQQFLARQSLEREAFRPYFEGVRKYMDLGEFSSLRQNIQMAFLACCAFVASPEQLCEMKAIQHNTPSSLHSILYHLGYLGRNLSLFKILELLEECQFSTVQKFYACQKVLKEIWSIQNVVNKIFSMASSLRFTTEEMNEIKQENWNQFLLDLFKSLSWNSKKLFILNLNDFSLDREGRENILKEILNERILEDQDMIDLRPLLPITEEEVIALAIKTMDAIEASRRERPIPGKRETPFLNLPIDQILELATQAEADRKKRRMQS